MSESRPYNLPPAVHHTIAVAEVHQLSPDGHPGIHVVSQEIEALMPIGSIPYYFDYEKVEDIQGTKGCSLREIRKLPSGIYAADLALDKALDRGERATLEYTAWFNYASPPQYIPPQLRRRVGGRIMERLDMAVRFSEGALPSRVWAAEWDSLEAGSNMIDCAAVVVAPTPVPADEELEGIMQVRRQETQVAVGRIVGFAWEW